MGALGAQEGDGRALSIPRTVPLGEVSTWQLLAGGWHQDVPGGKNPALYRAWVLGHGGTLHTVAGQELRLARTVHRMGWPWGQR